ncbi:MAG: TlpA family protein disulfide reductase [Anaerolineae bacterium]|jgi:peroxiredoxin|nr:TlpA family protein disulfide reductase [Anaerolineae bacterium]
MTPAEQPAPPADPRPSPVLLVFLIVPLLGLGIALLMILGEPTRPAGPALPPEMQAQSALLLNYAAPDFELPLLTGGTVRLADYRGQILFLNFWQTTCEPCVRELPALAEFAAEYAGQEAAVLAINFEETAPLVQAFFDQNALPALPVALDATAIVRRSYGVVAIPRTFVVDGEGIIRHMKIGEITREELEGYVQQVRQAAGG